MNNNIMDTALIFEGGGMRASYTAGFLNNLLENNLYFDYVAGISAGSSHSINYLSRNTERAKRAFVDIALDPNFGGWSSFLKGEGYFRSKYIYEETHYEGAALPFDFDLFMSNPAKLRIGAFDRMLGKMHYFSKTDMKDVNDLVKIVRASSSMPIFMPATHYGGHCYVDGGLGGGIALDVAKADGYKRFFVILTREKGYRKRPVKFDKLLRAYYKKYPAVAEALLNRHKIYNETLDELEALERQGKAFLVYPNQMPVSNREMNYHKLSESYHLGYAQGKQDVVKWKKFLNVDGK
ncbi:patatin-like phospholipase family protein [Fusibacter ferrireducens]|uniref:Patatin family protein n=1 Tax=Fusibacter ferrireducens TaxID=2785058 RepID=A0ABR9ZNP8_9FIRM|nr:patatin family protein [Fusibacter ferrireducens]MBF4692087.1 patatin family protein [Fusibacter ferrireducens]